MWVARDHAEYDRIAPLTNLFHNANIDPKKGKPTSPLDWNPWSNDDDRRAAKTAGGGDLVTWEDMGQLFKRSLGQADDVKNGAPNNA